MTFNPISRRDVLAALPVTAASMAVPALAAQPHAAAFPPGFLWGAATAAYQVEGNNINSDWWLLETLSDFPAKEPSGDAIDHYHLYATDIALLAKLGFNSYRFSIEWARIEPLPGQFSLAELNHYRDVLETCRRHGMKTVVSLHHFTSPRWLAAQNGFENPQTAEIFSRYAAKVVGHCGDLIDYLCTFNEANLSFSGFLTGKGATAMASAARANGGDSFSSFLFDNPAVSKPIVRQCHLVARPRSRRSGPRCQWVSRSPCPTSRMRPAPPAMARPGDPRPMTFGWTPREAMTSSASRIIHAKCLAPMAGSNPRPVSSRPRSGRNITPPDWPERYVMPRSEPVCR